MNYIVYRVEDGNTGDGIWYNTKREQTNFIKTIPNAKCADLPMPFHPHLYNQNGLAWFSATDKLEEIPNWCSLQDLVEMAKRNYHLYAYTVSRYRPVPGHVVFAREHVIHKEQIALSELQGLV